MTLIEKLKIEKKKWENKIYGVGETRIDLMIDDVIRELQTQQEEIEKRNRQLEERTNRIRKLEKSCQNYFDTLMEVIEQKNEKNLIIREMAKYISSLDIDEDICKKVDNPCKDYAGENKKTCDDCIKEYFINKIKKESKE